MRVNKKTDFEAISRRSIKRDFFPEQIYIRKKKTPEKGKEHKIRKKPEPMEAQDGKTYRIQLISTQCQYSKLAKFFVGKLVRLTRKTGIGDSTTGWYEFVHDMDRQALNQAAGWSDNKKEYLLERPKLK